MSERRSERPKIERARTVRQGFPLPSAKMDPIVVLK